MLLHVIPCYFTSYIYCRLVAHAYPNITQHCLLSQLAIRYSLSNEYVLYQILGEYFSEKHMGIYYSYQILYTIYYMGIFKGHYLHNYIYLFHMYYDYDYFYFPRAL